MKMRYFSRILCLLLAFTMLLSLIACGNETQNPAGTTEAPTTEDPTVGTKDPSGDETEGTTEPQYSLSVPEDLNYANDNRPIRLLYWEDVEHEEFFTDAEGETGDLIKDAIYERNLAINERLGITFDFIPQLGDSDYVNSWVTYVGNSYKSGGDFDIMGSYSRSTASCARQKYCANLLDEEVETYLTVSDPESPWWPATLFNEAMINDKLYFCSGDISSNSIYMMYTCFVNTNILEQHKLENPQEIVARDEWTFDKFIEMCKGVYEDLDGDQTKSETDRYGYMTSGIHMDPWFYGTGVTITTNTDGVLTMNEDFMAGNKITDAAEKLNSLLWSSNDGIYTKNVKHQGYFNDGNLLFCIDRARISITKFDSEDLAFVVVPTPKYDDSIKEYRTVMGNPFSLYAIEGNCKELEKMGAVLEVMAYESFKTVSPAIFEVTLKLKKVEDEVSGQMYDIIRKSIVYDIGRIYDDTLGLQSAFRSQVSGNMSNWASLIGGQKRQINMRLDQLVSSFDD